MQNQAKPPEPPATERHFKKKDREFLVELVEHLAHNIQPTYSRVVNWLDLTEVSGITTEGQLVSFQLSQVSHLTSQRQDGVDEEKQKPPDQCSACIHFLSGDFVVMRETFAQWVERLEVARHRQFNQLSEGIN